MAHIAAPVRKDTLEKESHAKVKFRLELKKSRRTVHQKYLPYYPTNWADYFFPIQLSFANLLCSEILRIATVMVMFT